MGVGGGESDLNDDFEARVRRRLTVRRASMRLLLRMLRIPALAIALNDEALQLKTVIGHAVAYGFFLRLEPLAHA